MTIQEAIKSGKKFRRQQRSHIGWFTKDGGPAIFHFDDALATDWEVLVCETHNETSQQVGWNCDQCAAKKYTTHQATLTRTGIEFIKVKQDTWKTLDEVAKEVAALKGCSIEDCFPFEITFNDSYNRIPNSNLILNSAWKNAEGAVWMGSGLNYKLADPCMWSISACGTYDGIQVQPKPEKEKEANPCTCDLVLLLQGGCRCGGS